MVEYYNFDKVIQEVLNKGKKASGLESVSLGFRLAEFEVDNKKNWILYLGDESKNQDHFENAWRNRLVVLDKKHSTLSEEALHLEIAGQFKQRVKESRKEDYLLSYFSEFLDLNNEWCYNV